LMIKLLILLFIAYLAYRAVKNWITQNPANRQTHSVEAGKAGHVDDMMVQDPFCKIHFPKQEGVHLQHEGKDYYFCSTACKDKYLRLKNEGE